MTEILTVDPGKQTGLALWRDGQYYAWDLPWEEAMDWVEDEITGGNFKGTVVSESISITAQTHKKGPQVLVSVEQIGIMRRLCKVWGLEFATQSPQEAKSFGTDTKLRALGWWVIGTDHARDAGRHMVLYRCLNDSAFASELAARL